MKHFKFLLVLFLFAALSSCEVQRDEQIVKSAPKEKYPIDPRVVQIFEYEGCEYLVIGFGPQMMSHKGNCKNSIHYENKNNAATGNR